MSVDQADATPLARVLAFYLPQFYPTPENDAWWGPGFTEWTNVIAARPLFAGHWAPRIPADTGFYDLRVPETRELQAELAAAHGIEGFVYWHYWFHGRRLLDRPFAEVLATGRPRLPFCLAWANESWERRWHGSGAGTEMLLEQTYSAEDDRAHARWLVTAMADDRYIRIDGRPLFLVYRPFDLPAPQRTLEILREETARAGLAPPWAVGVNAHRPSADTRALGFDLTLDFQPQLSAVPGPNDPGLKIYDYPIATAAMRAQHRGYPTHPCVMVSWDNSARRGPEGIVFINATPETFGANLSEVVDEMAAVPFDRRLVFVNAWNEWAEGNHLEPDLRYGHGWLEAVRDAIQPPVPRRR